MEAAVDEDDAYRRHRDNKLLSDESTQAGSSDEFNDSHLMRGQREDSQVISESQVDEGEASTPSSSSTWPSSCCLSPVMRSEHDGDMSTAAVSSSDLLIMKQLNEMKVILQQLLHDKQCNSMETSADRAASLNMLHEMLVESSANDSDLALITCMRQLYPLSVSSNESVASESADTSEEMMSVKSATSSRDTSSDDSSDETKSQANSTQSLTHISLGEYEFTECLICYETKWLYRRSCCRYAACTDCITQYFINKVQLAMISIECINIDCKDFVHRDEISLRLPKHLKGVYINLLINFNCDNMKKTCPKCNYLYQLDSQTQLKDMYKRTAKKLDASRVTCPKCDYPWCFICCAPWHEGITCKSYRKGDHALYEWARKTSQGQINAQKCPQCKILISKSSGCDHMHCLKCKTDFCYRCGEKLRRLKFFGDHYSKLSIFGCKYRYKASKPMQRKLIRGAVFGTKLFIAPIIGSVALFTGIAIIGIGITALPFYGGVQLYRKMHNITLVDSKDVNNNRYNIINGTLSQNKGFVSTAAQTIHVSFIDDNYVDELYREDTRRVT